MKPKFSILHTSARPDRWAAVYDEWLMKAANPELVEYVLCVDSRWGFDHADLSVMGLRGGLNVLAHNRHPYQWSGYVSGVNAAAVASSGEILVVIADDQFPCDQWDLRLMLAKPAGVDDFVIEVSTGTPDEHARGIMVAPILSRARYERLGFVFFPEYESMFADNDFAESANLDGVVVGARDLMFPHRHIMFDGAGKWRNGEGMARDAALLDAAYQAQMQRGAWDLGLQVLERRRATNFGSAIQSSENRRAVRPEQTAGPDSSMRTIALALSGEHFQGPWVDGILALVFHLIQSGWNVIPMREYTSNVYATRENLRQAILTLAIRPDLVLWLDDDNICSPAHFDRLLSAVDEHPEIDGVTGWCWIHPEAKDRFQPSVGNLSPDGAHWRAFPGSFAKETALRPAEAFGFPCVLMRLSAFEKAGDKPFIRGVISEMGASIGGEDIAFCRAAAEGGAKFLVDPQVRVPHLKYVTVEPTTVDDGAPEASIAVMMRVKNEARWIARAIDSVRELGPVFVMDDGSTDETREIAIGCGAEVYCSPFSALPLDEARDKNWLLDQVNARGSFDFILCIDGDEELEPGGVDKIRRACQMGAADVYYLRFLYLWDRPNQARFDGRYSTLSRFSLFRVTPGLEFKSLYKGGCNLGLHTGNAPIDLDKKVVGSALNVFLLHYGYMLRADRIRKYNWYNSIDVDPNNEQEDCYRHIVQGDLPEIPADAKLMHAGPLTLRTLPASMASDFDLASLERAEPPASITPIRAASFSPVKLNLGCSDRLEAGFINVDLSEPCDQIADLRKPWPWPDSSVDFIRAHDLIEHLPDKIFTMNEAFRVLKPGGRFEIVVPTTDGRGAHQDPTHVSYWNRNSFFYFERGNLHLERFCKKNGVRCSYYVAAEDQTTLGDGVVKLAITLEAVKPSNAMAAD